MRAALRGCPHWRMAYPDSIVIAAPGPEYNRFIVADRVQDACNPSGVARELVRIIASANEDPACMGTDWVRKDPAVRCVVDKLASLCGVQSLDHDAYDRLTDVLEAQKASAVLANLDKK